MSYSDLRSPKSRTVKLPLATVIAAVFIAAFSTPAMAGSYGNTSDPFDAAPSDNVDLPYTPAVPNADFSVPYSDALGSGGESWRGLLTGTMQTTAPCVSYNQATQAGGSATTTGSIAVYKSASEVANALSVSGSAGYKGIAKVKVSAGFSSSSSQSSNSIYAVASVYTNMGMVNLGKQTLLPGIDVLAAQIDTVPEAMRFISRCGDSYARGFTQGASWISVLEIKSSSSTSSSDIYASVSAKYAGFSASANFNKSASSQSSNSDFVLTEQCNGPLYCGESTISGQKYVAPGSCTSAKCELTTFTNNFSYMMNGGLAGSCATATSASTASAPTGLTISGPDAAKCVVAVQYAPIADLVSSLIPVGGKSRDDLASMDDLVQDDPKAPRILVSGPGMLANGLGPENGQVTVVVTPSIRGGQPDSFTINATNPDGSAAGTCEADFSVSETPHCVVTGLTNGVRYSFSARAVNSAGISGPSNIRFSTPSAQAINPDPLEDPVVATAVLNAAANNVASSLSIAQDLQKTMSPSELVRAAAYGVFGVQRNLSNWASEYQTIYNAEAENEAYNISCGAPATSIVCSDGSPARVTINNQLGVTSSDQMTAHWQDNVRNLNRQAVSCSREYLSINPACTGRATACWISSLEVASYTNEECQPNAFGTNGLLFIANPFDISSFLQGNDKLSPEVLEDATDYTGTRTPLPKFTLSSSSESLLVGTPMKGYTITSTGGAIKGFSIEPLNPAGTSFDPSTGLLSGTPTTLQPATKYTITGRNAGGATATTFTLTVTTTSCAKGGVCALGDTGPGGGKVFYVHASGTFACGDTLSSTCRYLEVAPNTWSGGSADPTKLWAIPTYQSADVSSITNDASAYNNALGIGLGYKNSLAIVAQGNNTTTAAGAARAYAGGSQSDWYLPTTAELNLLCQWSRNVAQDVATKCTGGTLNTGTGSSGGFYSLPYWSSSEYAATDSWTQNFNAGGQNFYLKDYAYYVRPVRAFG